MRVLWQKQTVQTYAVKFNKTSPIEIQVSYKRFQR